MVGIVVFSGLIFTIMGLADGGRVTSGLAMLWMACAALIALMVMCLRKLSAIRTAREQQARQEMQRIASTAQRLEARARWVVQGSAFALVLLLMGGGAWLAWMGNDPLISLALAAVFVCVSMLAVDRARQILQPGPMLVLDARGIHYASFGTVPWTEVLGIALVSRQIQASTVRTLKIGVLRPDRYFINATALQRWSKRTLLRKMPRYGVLDIPLDMLDQHPDLIHQTAQRMRANVSPAALTFWYPEMEPSQIETVRAMDQLDLELHALGPDPTPMQLQAHGRAMMELHPRIEAAARIASGQARRATRRSWLLTAGAGVLALAWLYFELAH